MQSFLRTVALTLCLALLLPPGLFAESPAVQETAQPACALSQDIPKQTQADPPARLLDEEEIVKLSARVEEPAKDVAGGALSNEHLTYVVIALAAAVVVLIAK